VRNDSPVPWPASAQVRVGNRWRGPGGGARVIEDGRAPIEETLAAGDGRTVRLEVMAPAEPGAYELEVDLIQEWIGWLGDRGSSSLRLQVQVDAADQQPAAQDRSAPTIEMHALSRPEVTATIEEAGGTVLAAVPRERCGPTMPSLDYVVGRASTPLRRRRRIRPARMAARARLSRWLTR
jgi:hypothetical protein